MHYNKKGVLMTPYPFYWIALLGKVVSVHHEMYRHAEILWHFHTRMCHIAMCA